MVIHAVGTLLHGINSEEWILLLNLHFLDVLHVLDGIETRVLSKSHWDLFQSIGKGSYCILFNTLDLVSLLGNLNSTSELCGTTTSNNVIIFDHVTDHTDGIKKTSLGLIANGSRSTSD